MKYNPLEARCVFIDGPVAVYVSEAAEEEILRAYTNLGKVVAVAARLLNDSEPEVAEISPVQPVSAAFINSFIWKGVAG